MGQLGGFPIHAGPVQTTGVTITTVISVDVAALPGVGSVDGAGILAKMLIIGKTAAGLTASWEAVRSYNRTSGTLAAEGASTEFSFEQVGNAALATVIITLDATGTTIRGRVEGVAATTINWHAYLALYSTAFTG